MSKWPSDNKINEVLKKVEINYSRGLPLHASAVDKLKHSLCKKIVEYQLDNNLTVTGLAKIVKVDRSIMSKVVHCHIDRFTIDKLIYFYSQLNDNATFNLEIAS